jgi:HTH-type transcriptional regulator / antitoxin HigA
MIGTARGAARQQYKKLLAETLPTAIHTEEENEAAIQKLEELTFKANASAAERVLAELLTVLIGAFEEEHYSFSREATPIEVLQELIDANGLKQKDLTDIFGTPSIVSEVLHGRRRMTTGHIKRLSERFHVSPEVFF